MNIIKKTKVHKDPLGLLNLYSRKYLPRRLFELGSSTGRDAYFFANLCHNVIGCDLFMKPIDVQNCHFIQADMAPARSCTEPERCLQSVLVAFGKCRHRK